jgi:hypothetical protein
MNQVGEDYLAKLVGLSHHSKVRLLISELTLHLRALNLPGPVRFHRRANHITQSSSLCSIACRWDTKSKIWRNTREPL